MKNRRGFTLIELLVVIMIIAILASLLIPAVINALRAGKEGAAQVFITTLRNAAIAYEIDQNCYPPDDPTAYSSAPLADALSTKGPMTRSYFSSFPPGTRHTLSGPYAGAIYNPLWASSAPPPACFLFYARNFPPGTTGHNKDSFDIWGFSASYRGGGRVAPDRYDPPDLIIGNW